MSQPNSQTKKEQLSQGGGGEKLSQGGGGGVPSLGAASGGSRVASPAKAPVAPARGEDAAADDAAAADALGGHSVAGHDASDGPPLSGAPISHSQNHRLDVETPMKGAAEARIDVDAAADDEAGSKRLREGVDETANPDLLKRAKTTTTTTSSSVSPAPAAASAAAPKSSHQSPARA
jgi:hypothetical protein